MESVFNLFEASSESYNLHELGPRTNYEQYAQEAKNVFQKKEWKCNYCIGIHPHAEDHDVESAPLALLLFKDDKRDKFIWEGVFFILMDPESASEMAYRIKAQFLRNHPDNRNGSKNFLAFFEKEFEGFHKNYLPHTLNF